MLRVVGAFSGNRCLKTVNRIIAHIDDQVRRFRDWAMGGFAGLSGALGALFDALKALFQPILDFIMRLLIVSANPFMLPVVLAAAVWLFLPNPLKPPVMRFIPGLLIAAVEAMPAFLPGLFPLASVMKAGVLGFLRHLRGDAVEDAQRIAASNKIASLLAGAGVQFIAGFAVGILERLIDGIIDPFKLLFMLFDLVMKGIAVVGRVVDRVVELLSPAAASWMRAEVRASVGPPPPGPAAAPAAAGDGAQAAPAAATPVAEGTTATGGGSGAILSRRPDTTGTITARGPPASGPAAPTATTSAARTEADLAAPDSATDRVRREVRAIRPPEAQARAPAGGAIGTGTGEIAGRRGSEATGAVRAAGEIEALPAGGAEGEASLDSDLTDEQIIANLPPSALSGVPAAAEGDVTAEGLEAGMRAEVGARGASVGGLARLLGEAWDAVMAGAARVGGMAAGWLMQFLSLPDYELGNKLGYPTSPAGPSGTRRASSTSRTTASSAAPTRTSSPATSTRGWARRRNASTPSPGRSTSLRSLDGTIWDARSTRPTGSGPIRSRAIGRPAGSRVSTPRRLLRHR